MTRLLEEAGELAIEINHFEGSGINGQKDGLPDRENFAKEIKHVLLLTLQITEHYHPEQELEESVERS
jgi:NTP pyrophosphatase (non-canonical NTP hydrolase)